MARVANIEFRYLYRDAGNFKNFGHVIFGNRNVVDAMSIEKQIRSLLSDDTFDASALRIPEMFFKDFPYDPELDHPMHEFEGLVPTTESVTDVYVRDIVDVTSEIVGHARRRPLPRGL